MATRPLLQRSATWRILLGLGWITLMLVQAVGILQFDPLERLETWSYDLRLRVAAQPDPDPRVVIVDLDERSLQEIGRWPWPRHRVAELVTELLDRQQAALVAFDVVFAEADESSGLPVLESLAAGRLSTQVEFRTALDEMRDALDRDAILARTIRGRSVLLGYYFNSGQGAIRSGGLPAPVFLAEDFAGRSIDFVRADGYGSNIPILQESASGAGHFTPLFDRDGLSRRVPLLIELDGDLYESLSLAAARLYLGGVLPRAIFGSAKGDGYDAIEWLQIGERLIPVDAAVSARIPYRGPQGSFPYVAAADLLGGRIPEASLAGRIVLVGTSAPGLMDLRATPVGSAYPGVEIHANMIAGILDGTIKSEPAYLLGFEVLVLLLAGGLLAFVFPRLGPGAAVLVVAVAVTTLIAAALVTWSRFNLVLPVTGSILGISGVFLLNVLYGLFVESRAKRQIAGLFGQYVPPRVVEVLADNPAAASMEGENRVMSVLFSDVRDFTSISESLPAPVLSRLMNVYLTAMTEVVQQHAGTIDKYIGDAIMAFWGAPLPSDTHALDAVRTAMRMQERAASLRTEFEARGWPQLQIGIGINTGPMNVGNMGSEFRRAYTVMGDSVNLGARLESLTKQYGAPVLVGEDTARAIGDWIVFRELDRIRVKGKREAVSIHEPIAERDPAVSALSPQLQTRCKRFAQMLEAYRATDWALALDRLDELQEAGEYPALITLYRQRIEHYRNTPPPPGWDGAFTFLTK